MLQERPGRLLGLGRRRHTKKAASVQRMLGHHSAGVHARDLG
jgi:hypothetical protein